jgi:hypothetical protein
MTILYVAPLGKYGGSTTCNHRMEVMEELGHRVFPISTHAAGEGILRNQLLKASHRAFRLGLPFGGGLDFAGANRAILETLRAHPDADLLWLDKAITILPGTLVEVRRRHPRCIIAGFSPDDLGRRCNQTARFLRHLPRYHVFFTTKSFNVPELRARTTADVVFVEKAFQADFHRPVEVTPEDRARLGGGVGFIGTFEAPRAGSMHYLAANGVGVRIWGGFWERLQSHHDLLRVEKAPLFGPDYPRAICTFDINLCFLRKGNRDRQTARSVEIPACGGFMLAERTDEHLGLFTEGQEAEYFSSDEELLQKCRYYLEHPKERARIAAAGRRRCLESGYSNIERMRWMLGIVARMRDESRPESGTPGANIGR